MRWLSQAQFIGTTARATSRGHPVRFLDEACKLQSFLRLCSSHTRIPGHCSPIPAYTHTLSLSLSLSPLLPISRSHTWRRYLSERAFSSDRKLPFPLL